MENHPKKVDVVERPTNQLIHRITQVRSTIREVTHLKTVSLPAEIVIKARSAKQDWKVSVNPKSTFDVQPRTQKRTARRGRPHFVQRANNLGACPRRASPYKIRDALNKEAFPAERALVNTQALMIWGKTRYGQSSNFFYSSTKNPYLWHRHDSLQSRKVIEQQCRFLSHMSIRKLSFMGHTLKQGVIIVSNQHADHYDTKDLH